MNPDNTNHVETPALSESVLRFQINDHGRVLLHGDGPDQCDHLGAREASVYEHEGTYYLHYDGAGPKGWLACLATSKDLVNWTKHGPVLDFGDPGEDDAGTATSPWVIREGNTWHMFYLASPNTTEAPDFIPAIPYLTMKARSDSPAGPWIKQKDVTPFRPSDLSPAYEGKIVVAAPGMVIRQGDEYLMFFGWGGHRPHGESGPWGNVGIARTRDLNGKWTVDPEPILPGSHACENSSVYYEPANQTWFLFTNHVEATAHHTDAIWVYWTKDLGKWNPENRAIAVDGKNSSWSRECIGMPSVIPAGKHLALLYDAPGGDSTSHMHRDIGLAWIDLPLQAPMLRDPDVRTKALRPLH